ncbi:unnamed protein product, partial [Ectocarpus sp. 12 AP-2014]
MIQAEGEEIGDKRVRFRARRPPAFPSAWGCYNSSGIPSTQQPAFLVPCVYGLGIVDVSFYDHERFAASGRGGFADTNGEDVELDVSLKRQRHCSRRVCVSALRHALRRQQNSETAGFFLSWWCGKEGFVLDRRWGDCTFSRWSPHYPPLFRDFLFARQEKSSWGNRNLTGWRRVEPPF